MGFYKLLSILRRATVLILLAQIPAQALLQNSPAAASEWGYENEVPPATGLSAGPCGLLNGIKTDKKTAPAKPAAAYKGLESPPGKPVAKSPANQSAQGKRLQARALPPNAPLDRNGQAVEDWLKLYAFASGVDLDQELKERARANLRSRLDTLQAGQVTGILDFWPRVESAAAASPEQKENYKALLRALLRIEAGKASAAGSGEQEIISQVLGPVRVAAQGTPPLTEDATEAYADMACFLYEQSHPGKTVNATDNRLVFASVIRTKFIEAPTQKDRDAVANFDLSWARFKILWTGADEKVKERLLAQWTHKESTAGGAPASDPTLEAVLHKGPWNELK